MSGTACSGAAHARAAPGSAAVIAGLAVLPATSRPANACRLAGSTSMAEERPVPPSGSSIALPTTVTPVSVALSPPSSAAPPTAA